ncbi:hypothetical protein BDW68DRAFT_182867 [Aspergillus falconensis]
MLFVVALIALTTSFKDCFSAGGISIALNLVIAFSSTLNTAIEFIEEVPHKETCSVDLDDGWLTSQGAEVVFENIIAGYRQVPN